MTWRNSRSIIDPRETQVAVERDRELMDVAPRLMANPDFRCFLHLMMDREQFHIATHERTPYEQGRLAFLSRMVGLMVGYSGDFGTAFMRESGERYAAQTRATYTRTTKKDNA